MSKHFVRIQNNILDLITAEDNITTIRHMPTDFDLELFEVEVSEAVYEAVLGGEYTIDCNFGLDVIEINGEVVIPTSKSFWFIPRFIVPLPVKAAEILRAAGIEENPVRLYSQKNLLWTKDGWGDLFDISLTQPVGNFGFVVPQCDIPSEVTSVEIYVCDKWCYLHLQTADSDVYIQISEIAQIV